MKSFSRLKILILIVFVVLLLCPQKSSAAALTDLSDTMSRLADSTPADVFSDHTIKFTTSTGAGDATDTIIITMPAGFTIGSVDYTDMDLSHGASTGAETEETLAAAASATAWGASFTLQVLTLSHPTDAAAGDIAPNDKVIVEIGLNATSGSAQIKNHATAATYSITIAGTFGDTGSIAIVILSNDQFTVTATVDPTITFSLSANSTAFGAINSSTVTTSSPNITLTVSTNAANGYSISVHDAGNTTNPGLYNTDAAFLVGSADYSYANTANLASVAGYGIQATSATATIDARYAQTVENVGGYEITAQNLATYASPASAHTVEITSMAKVTGATPAGSYTDTVTVIATGNF